MKKLTEAQSTGERYGLHPAKTLFGIDVWAQNSSLTGPPRTTFPPRDGGGTNTGFVSLQNIAYLDRMYYFPSPKCLFSG